MDLLGYTNQAQFLVNCGLTRLLAGDPRRRCGGLRAARRAGAEARLPGGNGRALQGHRAGQGRDADRCSASSAATRRWRFECIAADNIVGEMFSVFSARCVLVLAAAAGAASAADGGVDTVARAKYLWSQSPHGKMLERILPPSVEPGELPEPSSEGARLTARYCVQCHYLPSPQMHTAARWKTSVERMVWRMQGKGNMGS